MDRWIGRWLVGVGLIHMPVALIVHRAAWQDIAGAGFFNVVRGHVDRGQAAWFMIAGLLLLLLGAVIDALEKAQAQLPLGLGIAMLLTACCVLVLMPKSGTWLLLPPAFALIARGLQPQPW
ncbi:DUF6463 family protein [Ramlibacter sp. WS9]|uniref:DUF6463 family protein n=1 Tax=Ramlibacter sp. WS9 TaxID=1882741 RepID=UPI001142EFF8|nr:DUF6463 family protein [Ramlibacter sp. WS9]